MKKVIIASIDALYSQTQKALYQDVIKALKEFEAEDDNHYVVAMSRTASKLDVLPDFLQKVIRNSRGSGGYIQNLKENNGIDPSDAIILGSKKHDVYESKHSRTLLLRSDYAEENNPDDLLYEKQYGIGIKNGNYLKSVLKLFDQITVPWYFKVQISPGTTLFSLTDAVDYGKQRTEAALIINFRNYLKEGEYDYRNEFLIYFLISIYKIFKELEEIHYWSYYPSSSVEENESLDFFTIKARQAFGKGPNKPILLRTKASKKRNKISQAERLKDGCSNQFDTLIVNPYFRNKLTGKNICIIDDFSRWGTSCETARHLLESEGVNKLIFISLGKFKTDYYKFFYTLKGDVFAKYSYCLDKDYSPLRGNVNDAATLEFVKSLRAFAL